MHHFLCDDFRLSLINKALLACCIVGNVAFAQTAEFLFSFGSEQLDSPQGLAINLTGDIYVADRTVDRIQVFDSEGNYKFGFGSEGSGAGQFRGPFDVALNPANGNIHVVDHDNQRVQVFDERGEFQFDFGEFPGTPRSIGVDSEGNTYVDDGAGSVHVFDGEGNPQFEFDGQSSNRLTGIAIDEEEKIYVVGGFRVQLFDKEGNALDHFGEESQRIALDTNGDIYVTSGVLGREFVAVYDRFREFQFSFGEEGDGVGQFDGALGIAIDDSGRVFIADRNHRQIQVWQIIRSEIVGDFDGNGVFDMGDIDLLTQNIIGTEPNLEFDLTIDGTVDVEDLEYWIREVKTTWLGDANLDGEFNSTDLVDIFKAGEYEDDIDGISGWATGDWDADGDFDTSDLVLAFQAGHYVAAVTPVVLQDLAFLWDLDDEFRKRENLVSPDAVDDVFLMDLDACGVCGEDVL